MPRKKTPKRRPARRLPQKPRRWLRAILAVALLSVPSAVVYVVYLDYSIRRDFEGRRWALPARVYARPLELYAGLRLSSQDFATELEDLRYAPDPSLRFSGTYTGKGKAYIVHARGFQFWDGAEPARRFKAVFRGTHLAGLTSHPAGKPLGLVRLDPPLIGSIHPAQHEDRILIKLDQTPHQLVAALLAVEDRAFFSHFGLNPKAIARALWVNIKAAGVVQGGSTLTQQLVKNFFLTSERTLWRKTNEALMALLLEWHYEKDEILETYLNEIYLGQDGSRAIHGFGLASHYYFNRPLEQLRLPEIALLVTLVRGPSYYNPRSHPERARKRRDLVLDILQAQGTITSDQAQKAKAAALGVSQRPPLGTTLYPSFIDLVRRQLRDDYREEDLASEGLKIFTTLDPRVQDAAEATLSERILSLERRRGLPARKLEGAAVVTSSEGGEVLAVAGGRHARYAGFNRALDAVRPVGSLIKPAVYLTALARSGEYSLITLLGDDPLRLKDAKGMIWSPQNFDHKSHGKVTLETALAQSYNLATVRLGLAVGVENVIDTLRGLGVRRGLQPYPSLLLGAAALTPLEVAQMYQTLAAGGFYTPLRAIREVLDAQGKPLQRYELTVRQTVDPAAVYLVTTAMQEAVLRGTGKSLYWKLPKALAVAGKTGTTDELRDSWFAGFTGDRLAVVWLGMDNNQPAGLTGANGALQVWGDLMGRLHPQPLKPVMPGNVEWARIDSATHLLADDHCQSAVEYPFIQGSAPGQYAPCAKGVVSGKTDKVRTWLRSLFE